MPVPRRFNRRPPERDTTRINERIRVPEVRLIDDEGNQIGVLKTADALAFAQERELDLVEVAPEARPPVCRVLDYSKYKYEQAQKVKQARKHQQQITVREHRRGDTGSVSIAELSQRLYSASLKPPGPLQRPRVAQA